MLASNAYACHYGKQQWWRCAHGRGAFDDVIHSPIRLQVCAALAPTAGPRKFAEVQAELGITDSHLSKNVRVLVDAGYIEQSKRPAQGSDRPRAVTMLALTREGRAAYGRHAAWLERLTRGSAPS